MSRGSYWLQQSPQTEPRQECPPFAPLTTPQRALVDTLGVEEATGADEIRVLESAKDDGRVEV